jgi:hypothetical protein
MKLAILAFTLLVGVVGLADVAAAGDPITPGGPGSGCHLKWYSAGEIWGTGTPLDGTTIPFPYFECVW